MVSITRDVLQEKIVKLGWEIGEYSYGIPQVFQWGEGAKLRIWKYCSIAGGIQILLGGNHRPDWVTTYPFNFLDTDYRYIKGHPDSKGDVNIGNDVWLGQNCVILSGVTIGDGACIAAHAVVTKNVPPYGIIAGNPGRLVKMRFDERIVEALLEIKWWNWDHESVRKHIPLLLSDDIDNFITQARLAEEKI